MTVREYEGESKTGARARGRLSGKSFIILKRSDAVGDEQVKDSLKWARREEIRQELISNGTLTQNGDRYRFQKDHTFKSPSEAASIVWGGTRNGPKNFGINNVTNKASQPSPVLTFPIDDERAVEGYKKDQRLYRSERDAKLAELRKQQDGHICQACGFKLKVSGHFVIECHHTNPISLGIRETSLNDLVSLCPTCHRIAHTREPIYKVAEIASILQG